jgi:hypothetical protein
MIEGCLGDGRDSFRAQPSRTYWRAPPLRGRERLLQHLGIQEQQRAQRLILRCRFRTPGSPLFLVGRHLWLTLCGRIAFVLYWARSHNRSTETGDHEARNLNR